MDFQALADAVTVWAELQDYRENIAVYGTGAIGIKPDGSVYSIHPRDLPVD